MDSMRSLNRSLPKTKNPTPASQPDVTQSFRAAALTVTNLYKSAIAEIDKSHAEGYQEALRDLVSFLDRENLGVGDGEGWKIRQWVTERVDGALPGHSNSDSDDEILEDKEDKRARSSSPVVERNCSPEKTRSVEPPHAEIVHRSDSAPPIQMEAATTTDAEAELPQTMFQFSSPQAWPSVGNHDLPNNDSTDRRTFATSRRTSSRPNRSLQRAAVSNLFSLGNGAGQKRKMVQDFFNIDGFNDRREGGGGGGGGGGGSKRGRMS